MIPTSFPAAFKRNGMTLFLWRRCDRTVAVTCAAFSAAAAANRPSMRLTSTRPKNGVWLLWSKPKSSRPSSDQSGWPLSPSHRTPKQPGCDAITYRRGSAAATPAPRASARCSDLTAGPSTLRRDPMKSIGKRGAHLMQAVLLIS